MKTKRKHSSAKKAGIVHIGCYSTFYDMVNGACQTAKKLSGTDIMPRDLLEKLSTLNNIFTDLATETVREKGWILDIHFMELTTGAARSLRYDGPSSRKKQAKAKMKASAINTKNDELDLT